MNIVVPMYERREYDYDGTWRSTMTVLDGRSYCTLIETKGLISDWDKYDYDGTWRPVILNNENIKRFCG